MTNSELARLMFLQVPVILLTCRIAGLVAARFGQPQVVAEMVAGLCLGPSLLGLLLPDFQAWLFPWDSGRRDTQSYLYPLSQLGLALYMFTVGLEFRLDIVRSEWKSALSVSVAGMVTPFLLGLGLGFYFCRNTELFPAGAGALISSTFLAVSMCITAFPMLARIIHHKRLTGTRLGTVAIGAGAIDDATAWCLLALVLAAMESSIGSAVVNAGGGLLFVGAAFFVVRPLLLRFHHCLTKDGRLSDAGFVCCLILMCTAALATELLGLHAVFGAFVIGTVVPRGIVADDAASRLEPLTVSLLLPLFFTFSGLNTSLSVLISWSAAGYCLMVLLTAVLGKGVACWLAARATGVPQREALGIGVLMNARGLMELIIINIGKERGLISEELFAMLVVMAIVTTLMTSPLFDRIARAA